MYAMFVDPADSCQYLLFEIITGEKTGVSPSILKKLRFQKSRIGTMLIVFFNSSVVISPGKTINKEFHQQVLKHVLARSHRT